MNRTATKRRRTRKRLGAVLLPAVQAHRPARSEAQGQKARGRNNAAAGCESDDWEPSCYIGTPRCVGGHRRQSASLGRICHWCVCEQSRVRAARMRATPPSPPRGGKAPSGNRKLRPSQVQAVVPGRGLTLRSRRGPTALHQAREAPRHIMCLAGLVQYRWSRLTSNVRAQSMQLHSVATQ